MEGLERRCQMTTERTVGKEIWDLRYNRLHDQVPFNLFAITDHQPVSFAVQSNATRCCLSITCDGGVFDQLTLLRKQEKLRADGPLLMDVMHADPRRLNFPHLCAFPLIRLSYSLQ